MNKLRRTFFRLFSRLKLVSNKQKFILKMSSGTNQKIKKSMNSQNMNFRILKKN